MSDPEKNDEREVLWDRLREAVKHLEGAARCYAALLGRRAEACGRRFLRSALWTLGLAALGMTGIVLILSGVATLIEKAIPAPGVGRIIVGGAVVILFLVILVLKWRRDEGDSGG